MEALLRELWQLREIQELAQLMESGGGPALVTGLSPVHRAMTAAALRLKSGRPLLMLCADEGEARRQAADLRSLTGREPVLLTGPGAPLAGAGGGEPSMGIPAAGGPVPHPARGVPGDRHHRRCTGPAMHSPAGAGPVQLHPPL